MKKMLIGILCVVALFPVNMQAQETEAVDHFEKHIAIIGARALRVGEQEYVKQLFIKDFGHGAVSAKVIGLEEDIFTDNGEGRDQVANDGIYTSAETYISNDHNESEFLLSSKAVIDSLFEHEAELDEFLKGPGLEAKGWPVGFVMFKCKFKKCSCKDCDCPACHTTLGIKLDFCMQIYDCGFDIGLW